MSLAIQSEFFDKLFYGAFAESKQVKVELKDVSFDAVVIMLKVRFFFRLLGIQIKNV